MSEKNGKANQGELFLRQKRSIFSYLPLQSIGKDRSKRMRKFDTKVQYLKYKVLREVAR